MSFVRKRWIALLLVAIAIPSYAQTARRRPSATPVAQPSVVAPLAEAAAKLALDRGAPGVTIAVITPRETFAKGWGFARKETNSSARPETIYGIGSVTKQFTAAAIMRLVEQGKIDLDAPASRYASELQSDVTIRQLLTHTSGINDYFTTLTDPDATLSEAQAVALIKSLGRKFAPGVSWSYSNSGYYELGMIIERVSGRSYADYLEQEFFLPLGLTSTDYCGRGVASPNPGGYRQIRTAVFAVTGANPSLGFAAGAVCSSALDLLRWNDALAHGRVVSPASYAQMTTPVQLSTGDSVGYGFGLAVAPLITGHRNVWHDGEIIGFSSMLLSFPDDGVTIVVLINMTSDPIGIAGDTAVDLAKRVLAR